MIIRENFFHIFFGGFGIQTENRAQAVFFGSIAIVGRDDMLVFLGFMLLQFETLLLMAEVIFVPLFGQIITIIDETVS